MAQNIVINGTTYNGVDSVELTNTAGEKIKYIESPYPATGSTVAKIGTTEYTTVAEALANAVSGDTVLMVASSTESGRDLVVPGGVTLDISGNILTAESATAIGTGIITDTAFTGTLKVGVGKLRVPASNKYIPVYNAVDGYVFINAMAWDTASGCGVVTDDEAGTLTLTFIPLFGGKAATEQNIVVPLLGDGADDNEIRLCVRCEWDNATGRSTQEFIYGNTYVANAVNNRGGYAVTMTLNNYSTLKNLKLKAMIISNTGAEKSGTVFSYNQE